jgi:DNA invertase Pin-like site-specific DNA recombinase
MLIGYARTSTIEQIAGLDAQIRDLSAAGAEKIFSENVSSVDSKRPELEKALDWVREGDVLMVTKLDRLARSVSNFLEIFRRLDKKGVSLRILELGVDSSTATGTLVLNMMASIAQFEREIMLARQREGIAKAKAEGKYLGRKPTARAKADDVHRLRKEGMGATEIAKQLGLSRRSVYRILESNGQA